MKPKLTEQDFIDAAADLDCEVAAIKAVAEVESRGEGFLPTDEPKILYERHKFHKYTNGIYDVSHPDLSNPKAGGYGKESEQHLKLTRASDLNREAALKSCSWGKFQVMGFNWESLGYLSLQDFVDQMYESEGRHLESFVRFVETNHLDQHLRSKNWAAFAKGYNGPDYAINQYDTKMAAAYEKYSSE